MELVTRRCCVCGSPESEEVHREPAGKVLGLAEAFEQRVQLCTDCGFVYASPVLSPAEIGRYYETLSNYENPQHAGDQPPAHKVKFARAHELVRERFPAGFRGRALDIGCGVAYGLSLFQADGWSVVGVDPSRVCVERSAGLYGVRVVEGLFDADRLRGEGPFDLVLLSHVVEHLFEPAELLRAVASLCSPEALVYVEVPNLLKPWVPMGYFTFEHLNYFTPVTLQSLLSVAGYAPDVVTTFDNGMDVAPYYPVIASTWRPAPGTAPRIEPDVAAARGAIADYRRSTAADTDRLRERIAQVMTATTPGRLAVWGAGVHTSQLLSLTALGDAGVRCIFDNDPKKHGRELAGVPIVPFDGDAGRLRDEVDGVLISSRASEREIREQIGWLEERGVRVWTLYEPEPAAAARGEVVS